MAERKHRDLKGKPLGAFSCSHCKGGNCENCTDVMRVIFGLPPICKCTRPNHGGEAVNQQIKDPETGTVYGPGLAVTEEGGVIRECRADD